MNCLNIIGNVTKGAPEMRYTANGREVANFTIAVPDKFNRENTYFFEVVVWGKLAIRCAEWLDKGKKVGITGRLTSRSYKTQDGSKRKVIEIVADQVEFLTPKSESSTAPKSDWKDLGREYQEDPLGLDPEDYEDDSVPF